MKITSEIAGELVSDILLAKLVPMISGSPGVGKSDIVATVAKNFNLKLIDFRLSQIDPVLLMGFPHIEGKVSKFVPLQNFPLEGDKLPDGYSGWLLFFDEINTASNATQAAAYKIILDRMVGDHHLHKNVAVVAAGNLATDRAVTNRLSTAMQSRLIHLELEVSVDAWIKWAYENEIDYRIISFIKFRPDLLHKFDPKHSDNTFPCPRTWAFLSKIIKGWETISITKLSILAGTVGQGAGYEFKGFTDIMESLPSFDKMLNSPMSINIPDDPSILYAITGLLAHKITAGNIETLMQLINRLPLEFQIICLQNTIKQSKDIGKTKAAQAWISANAAFIQGE